MLFDAHRQLEGIERVEAEPFTEEGGRVLDVFRLLSGHVELRDHELFERSSDLVRIHARSLMLGGRLEGVHETRHGAGRFYHRPLPLSLGTKPALFSAPWPLSTTRPPPA